MNNYVPNCLYSAILTVCFDDSKNVHCSTSLENIDFVSHRISEQICHSDVKEIGNDKLNYKSYKSTLLLFKLNLKSCNLLLLFLKISFRIFFLPPSLRLSDSALLLCQYFLFLSVFYLPLHFWNSYQTLVCSCSYRFLLITPENWCTDVERYMADVPSQNDFQTCAMRNR